MISVIVPIYNIRDYLRPCIESIRNQTLKDFELLLVDDGSTDGSGAVCDCFAKQDGRIRVIHKENGGLSDARNQGAAQARGEWLTFIDGDDRVTERYLEALYENARRYRAQVSVVGISREESFAGKRRTPAGKNVRVMTGREASEQIVRRHVMEMIVAPGKLYHKSLKKFLHYPEGKSNEDEFVTYRALYEAERVAVSSEKHYIYVNRPGSIMQSDYNLCRLDRLEALQEAVDYFVEKEDAWMVSCAKLRYLTNLQIAWYRVANSRVISKRASVLKGLQERRRNYYRKEWKEIKGSAGWTERAAVWAFTVSPWLYGMMSRIYLGREKGN